MTFISNQMLNTPPEEDKEFYIDMITNNDKASYKFDFLASPRS